MSNTKPEPQDYEVLADGWIKGRRVKKGETIPLTPSEAKYENVAPAGAAPKKAAPKK